MKTKSENRISKSLALKLGAMLLMGGMMLFGPAVKEAAATGGLTTANCTVMVTLCVGAINVCDPNLNTAACSAFATGADRNSWAAICTAAGNNSTNLLGTEECLPL
ncbi:MAG TPA: hypothetical protein VKZ53_15930 [Candidatus Angelobacter sp.]|nr:hypothetical protein [Candidatus Angelobacter sp.]